MFRIFIFNSYFLKICSGQKHVWKVPSTPGVQWCQAEHSWSGVRLSIISQDCFMYWAKLAKGLRAGRQKWKMLGQRPHTLLRLWFHSVNFFFPEGLSQHTFIPSTHVKWKSYGLNVPLKTHRLKLSPHQGDGTRRWGLWEGGDLMNGVSALVRETPESYPIPFSYTRT